MKVDWDDEIPNRQKKSNVPKHQTETHVHPSDGHMASETFTSWARKNTFHYPIPLNPNESWAVDVFPLWI